MVTMDKMKRNGPSEVDKNVSHLITFQSISENNERKKKQKHCQDVFYKNLTKDSELESFIELELNENISIEQN